MPHDTTLFIQQLLATIDEGRRTGTHKLLTILALIDACALVDVDDNEPVELPVDRVADAVLRITWRQTVPYSGTGSVLTQMNDGRNHSMLVAVQAFREEAEQTGHRSVDSAITALPARAAATRRQLIRTLVENPLPRLQTTSDDVAPFLYTQWAPMQTPAAVAAAQGRDQPVLQFLPGAAASLVRIGPLLRPLVETAFVADVARWNGLATEETDLRDSLFGAERLAWPTGLSDALYDLQEGRCFYGGERIQRNQAAIDHFLPWSRTSLNVITNLVIARDTTNSSKSDLLPAPTLVERWSAHLPQAVEVAASLGQPSGLDRTLRVARSTYRHLPSGAPLWAGRVGRARTLESYADHDRSRVLALLGDRLDLAAEAGTSYG